MSTHKYSCLVRKLKFANFSIKIKIFIDENYCNNIKKFDAILIISLFCRFSAVDSLIRLSITKSPKVL